MHGNEGGAPPPAVGRARPWDLIRTAFWLGAGFLLAALVFYGCPLAVWRMGAE